MIVELSDTPASSTSHARNAIHPVQCGIFPNRLLLPHPDDEILSGYEEDVSSIRDGCTAWVKADPAAILERHLVNSDSANPVFLVAQDRASSSPNLEYRFNSDVPNRLREQRRLSLLSWNPGPQRGKESAIEKHTAEKWHIIALQEALDHLEHEILVESLSCDSSWWLLRHLVQQGHFSFGHQRHLR